MRLTADLHTPVVGVIGTGYVGLVTGACLAHLGHHVICGDIDEHKVERLNRGVIPIVEEGLEDLILESRDNIEFVVGATAVARAADILFLCLPTPQGDDGSADLSYVCAASEEIAPLLKSGAVVVNKSTVPVGSAQVVDKIIGREDISVVSNPEFLREGSAVHDFLHPDRVVVGGPAGNARQAVADLYSALPAEVILTDSASAEMIKYAANGFLATKIAFINSIAALCESGGANVGDVARGMGTDRRIGPDFLKPGPGFGGSCFPKDTRALFSIAAQLHEEFPIIDAVIKANDLQQRRMVDKIRSACGGELSGRTVCILGLTFKAGTDDLRESPSISIARMCYQEGAGIQGYDPTIHTCHNPAQREVGEWVRLCSDWQTATLGADVVVVGTEWPQFQEIDLSELAGLMRGNSLVDTRNLFRMSDAESSGLSYYNVGAFNVHIE